MFDLLFKCVWSEFYYYLVSILFLKQWFQGFRGLSDASVTTCLPTLQIRCLITIQKSHLKFKLFSTDPDMHTFIFNIISNKLLNRINTT